MRLPVHRKFRNLLCFYWKSSLALPRIDHLERWTTDHLASPRITHYLMCSTEETCEVLPASPRITSHHPHHLEFLSFSKNTLNVVKVWARFCIYGCFVHMWNCQAQIRIFINKQKISVCIHNTYDLAYCLRWLCVTHEIMTYSVNCTSGYQVKIHFFFLFN